MIPGTRERGNRGSGAGRNRRNPAHRNRMSREAVPAVNSRHAGAGRAACGLTGPARYGCLPAGQQGTVYGPNCSVQPESSCQNPLIRIVSLPMYVA